MAPTPRSRAKSTSRPSKASTLTLARWPVTSASISVRSSRVKRVDLLGVLDHGHQHLVEEPGGALDDVEVAEGHRIEGAGYERPGHPAAPPPSSGAAPCWRRTRVTTVSPWRRDLMATHGRVDVDVGPGLEHGQAGGQGGQQPGPVVEGVGRVDEGQVEGARRLSGLGAADWPPGSAGRRRGRPWPSRPGRWRPGSARWPGWRRGRRRRTWPTPPPGTGPRCRGRRCRRTGRAPRAPPTASRLVSEENIASRTRSVVGRSRRPGGASSRRPPATPATTLIAAHGTGRGALRGQNGLHPRRAR